MAVSKRAAFDEGLMFDPELDPGALGFFGETLIYPATY